MNELPRSLANPISILHEDDRFIVFNKPAGLLSVPTPKKEKNTLVDIVNFQYAKGKDYKLYPCHRLDRDTSGVIIFSKGVKNQQWMMDEFKFKRIKKNYIAYVYGKLRSPQGEIRKSIAHLEERKFAHRPQEKMAITRYKVLNQKHHFAIVEVEPVTGRTNQIRIHFSMIGHPIVGERKYAIGKDYNLKFRRPALHSQSIQWKDPFQNKLITVESPLPKDMEVLRASN